MVVRGIMLLILAVALTLPVRAAEATLPEQYLAVYLKINEAEQAERHQDYAGALDDFKNCYRDLVAIQKMDPYWESALVLHRLSDAKAKIIELTPKAAAGQPAAPGIADFVFSTAPSFTHNVYAWKENITTREFWIGEDGSKASAWAAHWVSDNGGPDVPDDRNGYATGEHASKLNPFYVALPFNDLAEPDLAQKWLPKDRARTPGKGTPVSACKDRWVELKNGRGDVCYAQWEDAGPKRDDEGEYVFGTGTPANGEAGIGLSPAVADYLGRDLAKTVSWRFVDDADVRPGAWLKLDEQAVIYRAMHHIDAAR